MERRHFLKLAFGVGAGAAALATTTQAAPFVLQSTTAGHELPPTKSDVHAAVVTGDEVKDLEAEQVGWHHGWRHRHWGWRHRHWGWRHHRWHRHYW